MFAEMNEWNEIKIKVYLPPPAQTELKDLGPEKELLSQMH